MLQSFLMMMTHFIKDFPLFKSRRALFLPYIALFLVCIVYSVFWFYGKSKAEEKIAALLEARGDISCNNHDITGFPFSYILVCDKASFIRGDNKIEAESIKAIIKPWNPRHIIVEVTTPLILMPQGRPALTVKAESMIASFSETVEKERRLSLLMNKAEIDVVTFNAGEFHFLQKNDYFKQSLVMSEAKTPLGTYINLKTDFAGEIDRTSRIVKIDEINLIADDFKARAVGNFTLSSENRPDGKAKITFLGLEPMLSRFGISPGTLKTVTQLFARKTTLEGVDASELTLDIRNGRVMVGPLAVYTIAPLF